MKIWLSASFFLLFSTFHLSAQGLLDELNDKDTTRKKVKKVKVYDTFAGTRLINMHTIETYPKHTFVFIIQHRFGRLNSGFFDLFGLDNGSMRFGFEYAILNNLNIGIGRSGYNRTWDAFAKYTFLQQSKGPNQIPLSMSAVASIAIDGRKKLYADNRPVHFSQRLSFSYQLLIARKFTRWLSVQLTPSLVHENLVATKADKNLLFIMGGGARFHITPALSITGEYHYRVLDNPLNAYRNSAGIGVEINTGGHIFQITLSNSSPMFDPGYLRKTSGNIAKGEIHLGFNITRNWGFGKGN